MTRRRIAAPLVLLVAGNLVSGSGCGSSDSDSDSDGGTGGTAIAGSGSGGQVGGGFPGTGGNAGTGGSSGGEAGASETSGGRASAGESAGGATGEANAGEAGGLATGGDGNLLHGRVVDIDTDRPLRRRIVVVGRSLSDPDRTQTLTNDRGEFTLPPPSGTYDAAVIEPDMTAITVYQGLNRLEPLLAHRWARTFPVPKRLAKVSGNVSGGATYPLSDPRDVVTVHLFTDESVERYLMGAGGPPYGPDYVTTARFDSEPLSSTLVALGTFGRKDDMSSADPAYTALSASSTRKLSDGDMVALDLDLEPVELGEIAGAVTLPEGRHLTEMREHYRYPFPQAIVDFPAADYVRENPVTADGAFIFELPELTEAGASLCLAGASDEADSLWTERCGLSLGDDAVAIELQPAPVLEEPSAGTTISGATTFSWSAFEGGIHELVLWNDNPTPTSPGISVFTAGTETTLPDLDAVGVNVPTGVTYSVTLRGRGPFASLDEAVGSQGMGAIIFAEARISASAAIDVVMNP